MCVLKYAIGDILGDLNTITLGNQTIFDHKNTGLIDYLDPHCTTLVLDIGQVRYLDPHCSYCIGLVGYLNWDSSVWESSILEAGSGVLQGDAFTPKTRFWAERCRTLTSFFSTENSGFRNFFVMAVSWLSGDGNTGWEGLKKIQFMILNFCVIIGTKSMQNNISIGRAKIIWQPWSQSDSSGNLYFNIAFRKALDLSYFKYLLFFFIFFY